MRESENKQIFISSIAPALITSPRAFWTLKWSGDAYGMSEYEHDVKMQNNLYIYIQYQDIISIFLNCFSSFKVGSGLIFEWSCVEPGVGLNHPCRSLQSRGDSVILWYVLMSGQHQTPQLLFLGFWCPWIFDHLWSLIILDHLCISNVEVKFGEYFLSFVDLIFSRFCADNFCAAK